MCVTNTQRTNRHPSPHFTEISKSDYSLSMRTLFIIPLVLMSLVSFPSWGETLTMDDLVEGQKDTVIKITPTPIGKKTTPQQNYDTMVASGMRDSLVVWLQGQV